MILFEPIFVKYIGILMIVITFKHASSLLFAVMLSLTMTVKVYGQERKFKSSLIAKLSKTPADAMKIFQEAGMSPAEHALTVDEIKVIEYAFDRLPPLHQRVLKEHLSGISFLDDMANTALTSLTVSDDSVRRYHITFRAGILKQTVSEWLAEKERTCFKGNDGSYQIACNAGKLNAMVYVLLHETTHVVDGALGLFTALRPDFDQEFRAGVWKDRTTLVAGDTLLSTNRFRRGGRVYPFSAAKAMYQALDRTTLVSLYSTSSVSEDLAELLTVYHLTQRMHQPFQLILSHGGRQEVLRDPVKNGVVRKRMRLLDIFYRAGTAVGG